MRQILLMFIVGIASLNCYGQRVITNINRNWEFVPGWEVQKDKSTTINIPHTWNLDALSGKWDYYRGLGNYYKMMDFPASWKDKRIYLRCKGVNEIVDIYINSKHIGQHRGGYTAFAFDITNYVIAGSKNSIWMRVTNALNLDVMPLVGDFNFYGGVYRDVEIVATPKVHFTVDHYGSSGLKLRTYNVNSEFGDLAIDGKISSPSAAQARVRYILYNKDNEVVDQFAKNIKINEQGQVDVDAKFVVNKPHLWNSVDDPYLYRVSAVIEQLEVDAKSKKNKIILDSINEYVGFRYYEVDKNNKFWLNGKRYQIKGVGRHQDWAMLGNAIYKQNHEQDVALMVEMGVNAVRLAHYPQDEYFISLCDKAGIMVWSEIPFVGPGGYRDKGFNDSQPFMDNGELQLREMIAQLGNHPSIMWWGIFNELNQRGDDPLTYLKHLNSIAKDEDPTRLTVAASNQDGQINFVTDLIGFNQYFGWYGGEPGDIKPWQETLKKEWPQLKVSLAEYGAGGSIYQHSDSLTKSVANSYWHPEQWQTHFHEVHWREIVKMDALWGTFVWAMFDFGAAHRTEGLRPGINDKGLVTFDRQAKKDAFYFYKANWNKKDTFVYICQRRWQDRPQVVQTFKVFSNCKEVELYINGISRGIQSNDGFGTFTWKDVELKAGRQIIEAYGGDGSISDKCEIVIDPGLIQIL